MKSCKVCKQKGTMEEYHYLDEITETMTREKIEKCSNCSATCKTIYKIKDGSSREEWMDENGVRQYF